MNGSSWCAMFVSYCAYQAGVLDELVPRYAWCPSGMTWYKNKGRYHKRNTGYIPRKGDIIFFYSNAQGRVTHTGIVVDGDAKTVITIEGNTSKEKVAMKFYDLDTIRIDGYGDNGGERIYTSTAPSQEISQKTFRLREDYEKTIRYGTTFWIRLNNPNPNPVMDRQ
ncbi:CHAP domain-containing protein [Oribacterium sp. oral taxon 102]|uniref:CHAP domain-containing protein n=1 Tax=Oribacterium sp. oral taxon 102 TaxID=671214 RepID=UPI001FAE0DA0|nr:CHAP domain-containing protein [Oribacterium sp. oral taxon 102]